MVAEPSSPSLTPRRVTWLVLRRTEKGTDERQQLTQLRAEQTEVAEALALAQDWERNKNSDPRGVTNAGIPTTLILDSRVVGFEDSVH